MRSVAARPSLVSPLLGLTLLLPPILMTARWILVWNRVTAGQADRVAEWLSILPSALRDARLATWILILLSAGGTVAGFVGVVRSTGTSRTLSGIPLLVGGLLTLWFLFTLM